MRALQETSNVPACAKQFRMQARIATTDQHLANILCEKLMTASSEGQWTSLHLFCTMHQAARCMTRSFVLVEEHVSGLVNYALSLGIGANMIGFRAALASVLAHRPLLIHRMTPPAHVVQYQTCMLDLFCSTGTRQKERRLLLEHLATGDWHKCDVLEIYIAESIDVDTNLLVQNYIQGLLYALCNKSFTTYPRHRWLGCDAAVDEICLLQSCHGLASAAYQHWCYCLGRGSDPANTKPEPSNALMRSNERTSTWQDGLSDVEGDQSASDCDDVPAPIGERDECAHAPANATSTHAFSQADRNDKRRRKVLMWLSKEPFA
eukprot:6460245-Amphidinium_carterae.2